MGFGRVHEIPAFAADSTLRVWRRLPSVEGRQDWHVSHGSYSPRQELRRLTGYVPEPGSAQDLGGLCWDEALESLAVLMIAPGAARSNLFEAPLGDGWELVMEFVPSGRAEWCVSAADRTWGRLQVGEALATFVHHTHLFSGFPGFRVWPRNSFALVAVPPC